MLRSHLTSALALTLVLGAAPLLADQATPPPQPPPARAAQAAPVMGDLVSVDTDAKIIVVKANDAEVKFLYDDKTEISGAKGGAAGLATMKNSKVTVHFTEDAKTKAKLATRVIVEPPK